MRTHGPNKDIQVLSSFGFQYLPKNNQLTLNWCSNKFEGVYVDKFLTFSNYILKIKNKSY